MQGVETNNDLPNTLREHALCKAGLALRVLDSGNVSQNLEGVGHRISTFKTL